MNETQKNALKAILVFVYALTGASVAIAPAAVSKMRHFPVELTPHFEVPACVLLGMVLLLAMWLGGRGKTSASWAVIAYGSLSVALIKNMVVADWYGWDQIHDTWAGMAIVVLLVCGVVSAGLYAAWRNRWKQMIFWSLLVFIALFVYTPSLIDAQYSYCQRHDLMR